MNLDEMKRLLAAASPGPWEMRLGWEQCEPGVHVIGGPGAKAMVYAEGDACDACCVCEPLSPADAALVVFLRNHAEELHAAAEQARGLPMKFNVEIDPVPGPESLARAMAYVEKEVRARLTFTRDEKPAPAPHIKVTEVVGAIYEGNNETEGYVKLDESADRFSLDMADCAPQEARAKGDADDGPRGRFRITVEWWPEGSA